MTTKELGERVARTETAIENICHTLENLTNSYSDFKKEIFEKFDNLDNRLRDIETTLKVKKEEREISWKWLIFLTGLITFTLDHIPQIVSFFKK